MPRAGFNVKVGIDDSIVKRGLRSLGDDAKQLGGRIGGAALNAGKMAAAFAAAATAAAAIGAIKIFKDSSKAAADLEMVGVAFKNLLGSTEEMEKRLKALDKFSVVTPFEPAEIRSVSLMLEGMAGATLAVGQGLELVGNAAASRGKDIEEVGRNIALVFSGLTEGGEVAEAANTLLRFGLITGETKTQWQEFVKDAKAGEREYLDAAGALAEMTGKMRVSGTEMAEMSTTFKGLVSTVKGNVGLLRESLGKGVNEGLKGGLAALNNALPQWRATAEKIGDSVGLGIAEGIAGNPEILIQAGRVAGTYMLEGMTAVTVKGAGAAAERGRPPSLLGAMGALDFITDDAKGFSRQDAGRMREFSGMSSSRQEMQVLEELLKSSERTREAAEETAANSRPPVNQFNVGMTYFRHQ